MYNKQDESLYERGLHGFLQGIWKLRNSALLVFYSSLTLHRNLTVAILDIFNDTGYSLFRFGLFRKIQ